MTSADQRAYLYSLVLGQRWSGLHPELRRFHESAHRSSGRGDFEVTRGPGLLGRMISAFIGAPPTGERVTTELSVERTERDGAPFEIWARRFDGHALPSEQYAFDGLLLERGGPFEVAMRLEIDEGALRFIDEWMALRLGPIRIKLPRFMSPRVHGVQAVRQPGRLWTDIRVEMALIGPIVRYVGELDIDDERSE